MAAPQWVTSAGSLGTAVELKPFELELAVATGNSRAEFLIVSGILPPGLILTPSGNIKGYPSGKLSGVPLDVNEEKIFTFVIRCTNDLGELSDSTFSITVTGQDAPQPRTAPYANQNLGSFADGTWVEIDATALDTDPGDTLTYRIVGGSLPPGLALSTTGRITGYVEPVEDLTQTFNFDININDGKTPVIASYNIVIVQSDLISSGATEILTDSSLSDSSVPFRAPVLLDRGVNIDTVLDENYFYYKFRSRDFDGDAVGFEVLPIVRRPTAVSSVQNVTLTLGDEISVDGVSVILTGTSIQDLAAGINRASVSGVYAQVNNGYLLIYTVNPTLELIEVGGSCLEDLGLITSPVVEYTESRNADDTDGVYVTQDLDEVLPQNLAVNTDTGWLYGYIEPITQGEKYYDFWLRVYKKRHEASEIQINTDYATTLPFSLINFQTQAVLDQLGLDQPQTDFVGKTIVFLQQENLEATYTGLSGATYTTDPLGVQADGWFDQHQATVTANSVSSTIQLGASAVAEIAVNSVVTGPNILTSPQTTVSSKSAGNVVLNQAPTGTGVYIGNVLTFTSTVTGWTDSTSSTSNTIQNQRAGLWRFAESSYAGYYALEFVQEIQQGTIVYARRHTGTLSSAVKYSEPSVKRMYQLGSNWDPTTTVVSNSVITTVIVTSVAEIEVGALVTGTNVASGAVVSSINVNLSTLTLNAAPTGTGFIAGSVLTVASSQIEPRYTQYHLINPSSTLGKKRLTISSSSNYLLNWITDADLGDIVSGVPSRLAVTAENQAGGEVQYRFVSKNFKTVNGIFDQSEYITLDNVDNLAINTIVTGAGITGTPLVLSIDAGASTVRLSTPQTLAANTVLGFAGNDLPRGLRVAANGEIQGRPSHQHFALNDSTSFDQNQTTWDRTYAVNIQAETFLNDPLRRSITSTKTFIFRVLDYKTKPSNNFYLHFALNQTDRAEIFRAIHNDLIIPDEHVYRADDHWWGRPQHCRMLVAYGLDPATDSEVASVIAAYHYKKRYIFRDLKWAQSLDSAGNPDYEVIYIDPVDQLTTAAGKTITGSLDVRDLDLPLTTDALSDTTDLDLWDASLDRLLYLYPASLPNMQNRLQAILSPSNRKFLSSWMTSRQPNNRTLNYTPAIPLVYLKPGTGLLALYKLKQVLNINRVNALVDRYAWDDGLTLNYDLVNAEFLPNPATTWDQILVDDSVPIRIVADVDFAVDAAFCQVNGLLTQDLQFAGTVDGYRGGFHNKTLVFYKQENFAAAAVAELPDFIQGWGRAYPGYDEAEQATLTSPTEASTVLSVDSVIRIRPGMLAQGTGIAGSPSVVSVNTVANTVTISIAQTLNTGVQITFVDQYDIAYEGYRVIPGWVELSKTQTITATVDGATVSSIAVTLDTVYLIRVGQVVSGTGIAGSPVVIDIDPDQLTITLNSAQTLSDQTVLTFATPGAAAGWSSGATYAQSDIVLYASEYYVCIYGHAPQASFPTDWFVLLDLPQSQYQRAGIWRMIENEQGIITLRFEQELAYTGGIYDSVTVRSGVRHGGQIVSLVDPETLGAGYTVPGFINRDTDMSTAAGTVFDNRTTEFFDENTDTYLESDQGTKYIKFIRNTIIDRGIVDV